MSRDKKLNKSIDLIRKSILEYVPDSVEILDANFNIIDCNKEREKLTGHSRSELIGKHVTDFFTSESKKKYQSLFLLKDGDIDEGEFEIITKDERIIPIWRKTRAIYDKKNRFIALISYSREIQKINSRLRAEISYRKAAIDQLYDKEQKYKLLFDESKDAIFIMAEGMIIDCNKAAEKIFAGTKDSLLNASITDFIPDDIEKKDVVLNLMGEKITNAYNGKPQRFKLELCRMDKVRIHAEITLNSYTLDKQQFLQAIIRDISEQHRYEMELKKSRSLFQGVINASQNAIIGIDQTGRCFLFNPGAEKIFHQSAKDVLGTSMEILMPERYKSAHKNGVKNIFKSGEFDRLTNKIYRVEGLRKDGSEFPIEFSFSYVSVNNEKYIIAFGQDITDRVLKEKELIESEKKFRQLFHDLPDAVYISSLYGEPSGRILDVNKAAERQSGYTRDELLKMNILSDLCAEKMDPEIVLEREKELEKKGYTRFIEKKVRKDKRTYWTDVILTKINYNNADAVLSINRDVSDKLAVEEKVIKLSTAFEQSPVFFMITDAKGRVEYVNNHSVEILGYAPDALIGKYFRYKNFPVFPKEEFKNLWSALEKGTYWRNELRIKKDEQELYVSASVFPIKNDQGEIINYLGVIEDRTEQKLLRDQLFQIQKMDSIGALTGGIAHDFNNLLSVINGYSELALNKIAEDNEIYQYIKSIFSAGEKASRLVRQLLTFTRQQVVDTKIINLNTVINELSKMIVRLIGSDIHFETDLEAELPPIKADPVQIEQILINLIVNARDAINCESNSKNYRRIKVETKKVYLEEPFAPKRSHIVPGTYILCTVSDTGIGMPKEIINRIFEPFFTTKEKGRGTGLGLSTVYGIVKQNNGDIQVYSVVGKGTTFKIYWPVTDSLPENKKVQKKIIKNASENERILLIDDDPEVRTLAKEMLESLGYKVKEVDSGKDALELLQSDSCNPDLIITDLVMPEIDGIELAQRAKKIRPGIKVLYASGFADDRFFKRDQSGIENHFIQKPYTLYSMSQKIREILDSDISSN